jgi:hypothetical protein
MSALNYRFVVLKDRGIVTNMEHSWTKFLPFQRTCIKSIFCGKRREHTHLHLSEVNWSAQTAATGCQERYFHMELCCQQISPHPLCSARIFARKSWKSDHFRYSVMCIYFFKYVQVGTFVKLLLFIWIFKSSNTVNTAKLTKISQHS